MSKNNYVVSILLVIGMVSLHAMDDKKVELAHLIETYGYGSISNMLQKEKDELSNDSVQTETDSFNFSEASKNCCISDGMCVNCLVSTVVGWGVFGFLSGGLTVGSVCGGYSVKAAFDTYLGKMICISGIGCLCSCCLCKDYFDGI